MGDATGKKSVIRFAPPEEAGAPGSKVSGRFQSFEFQEVFQGDCNSQEAVYSSVAAPIVRSALEGYNGTLFAYGQTGSGKTFTMTGGESYGERGIVPRALQAVYAHADEHPEAELQVAISYLEIYNEQCFDLLDTSHTGKPITEWKPVRLRHDAKGRLAMLGLQSFEAPTEQDALNLLFLGNMHRMTAETLMNHASSRSHCVFSVEIRSKHPATATLRLSKLHMVDLAGSERVFKTESIASGAAASVVDTSRAASKGRARSASRLEISSAGSVSSRGGRSASSFDRRSAASSRRSGGFDVKSFSSRVGSVTTGGALTRKEGRYINLSLHYLEKVIISLQGAGAAGGSQRASSRHIPYRNSVLTSVLQDSLGGNCRTAFLVTLNPEPEFTDESVATCRFAQRCGMVATTVKLNTERDLPAVVSALRKENQRLQSRVAQLGGLLVSLGIHLPPADEKSDPVPFAEEGSGLGCREVTSADITSAQQAVGSYLRAGITEGLAERTVEPHAQTAGPAWYWLPGLDMPQLQIAAQLMRRAVIHASKAAAKGQAGSLAAADSAGPSPRHTEPRLAPVQLPTPPSNTAAGSPAVDTQTRTGFDEVEARTAAADVSLRLRRLPAAPGELSVDTAAGEAKATAASGLQQAPLEPSVSVTDPHDTDTREDMLRRMLLKGAIFLKLGKHGLKRRFVNVSPDMQVIYWRPANSSKMQGACDVRALQAVVRGSVSSQESPSGGAAQHTALSLLTKNGKAICLHMELPAGLRSFEDASQELQGALVRARDVWVAAFLTLLPVGDSHFASTLACEAPTAQEYEGSAAMPHM